MMASSSSWRPETLTEMSRTSPLACHSAVCSTRSAEHPAADVVDLAGLFEDGDELVGFDVAERRVFPTQQRFHAHHAQVVEVVDRLIGEPELIIDECRTKFELELHVARDLGLQLGK